LGKKEARKLKAEQQEEERQLKEACTVELAEACLKKATKLVEAARLRVQHVAEVAEAKASKVVEKARRAAQQVGRQQHQALITTERVEGRQTRWLHMEHTSSSFNTKRSRETESMEPCPGFSF
jgi:hypothetical protein